MRGTLPNTAVSDGFFSAINSLTSVEDPQFIGRFERTIISDSLAPRYIHRAGNVATPLRTLLRKVLRCQEFATIFNRSSNINQVYATRIHLIQYLVSISTNVLISYLRGVGLGSVVHHIGGQGSAF